MHKRTYKYRLYPTKAQQSALQKSLDACRWVYNQALAVRKDAWEQEQKAVSRYDTIKMLPIWKQEHGFLKNAYSQCLQETCTRVDLAFKAFFRRAKKGQKPGYPRFRGKERYDSFTYPQSGYVLLDKKRLRLSTIGELKIKLHRPMGGKIKNLTIRRDGVGNWYACFSCRVDKKRLPQIDTVVGVDVGLTSFATYSNGEKIDNPRFFRREENKLAKEQRRLSKADKGTPERAKRRKVVAHIHRRIANKRRDFAHKLSRQLVNNFGVIAFEKLDIQDMTDGNWRSMNKSISDVAWKQFVQFVAYKAEDAGRNFVQVDSHNTTKMCSCCGRLVEKDLSVRIHKCPFCGLVLDRDENAAINILRLGIQSLALA
jgi:putative transposase